MPATLVKARPPALLRGLAHLLVLSVVLAILPIATAVGDPAEVWLEDVGDPELALPEGNRDPLPTVEPSAAAEAAAQPAGEADSRTASPSESAPRKLSTYAVRPGDTLSRIASQFELTIDTLVWANDLVDPDLLVVGSKLTIPPGVGVLHRVRPGDTVADLAAFYAVEVQKIVEANALESPEVILVGQRLLMPEAKMPMASRAPDPAPSKPAETGDAQAPRDGPALASMIETGRTAPKPLPVPSGASAEQASFILSVAGPARASQRETGVPASVSIAQAILESFWGSSRLSRENNNYFGIKAREHPGTAGVVWFDVWEVIGGANVVQREPFRAYNSAADSFIDHGRFFHQNSRYAGALAASSDPARFAREINAAGYATDPGYAAKLIGLMERFNLYQYDQ